MADLLRPFCGGDGGIWFHDDRFAEKVLASPLFGWDGSKGSGVLPVFLQATTPNCGAK
jgi:hypothetical protein